MQCLKSNSGGYFENICPQPKHMDTSRSLSEYFFKQTLGKLMVDNIEIYAIVNNIKKGNYV